MWYIWLVVEAMQISKSNIVAQIWIFWIKYDLAVNFAAMFCVHACVNQICHVSFICGEGERYHYFFRSLIVHSPPIFKFWNVKSLLEFLLPSFLFLFMNNFVENNRFFNFEL